METAASEVRGFGSRWLPGAGLSDNYEHDILLPPKQVNRRAKRANDSASKPSYRERAVDLVKRHGVVKADDFKNVGVYRPQLAKLCSEGLLTRVARGRYAIGLTHSGVSTISAQR